MSNYIPFVSQITVAFDETATLEDVDKLFAVFASGKPVSKGVYTLRHVSSLSFFIIS